MSKNTGAGSTETGAADAGSTENTSAAEDNSSGAFSEALNTGAGEAGDQAGGQAAEEGAAGDEAPAIPDGYTKIPGADSSDDDRAAFNKAFGVPDSVDGYDMKIPEGYNGGDFAKDLGLKAGLSPAQLQAVIEADHTAQAKGLEEMKAEGKRQIDEATTTLKSEWGKDFDTNVKLADRAIAQFGGDELSKMFSETGFDKHPTVIKAFAEAGKLIAEDGSHNGGGAHTGANPYTEKGFNLTEQATLERENPTMAASLKAAAGKKADAEF